MFEMEQNYHGKAEDMGRYQELDVDHSYTEFPCESDNNTVEVVKDITCFGEFVANLQSMSLEALWERVSPVLRVVGVFICMFITEGVVFTFSHTNPSTITREPYQMLSGKLQLCIYSLSAPLAAHLCSKFGCRAVCVGGTILAAIGFLLAGHMVDPSGVVVGLGSMVGVGMAFISVSSIISLTDTEADNKFFAISLSLFGIVISRLASPSLVSWVVEGAGWRTGYQALGGLATLCLVCALLLQTRGEGAESVDSVGHSMERRPCTERMVGKKLARSHMLGVFLVCCLGQGVTTTAVTMMLVHRPRLEQYQGLHSSLVSTGYVLGGLTGLVLGGASKDRGWFCPLHASRAVVLCAALASVLHSAAETQATTFILSTNTGFFTGIHLGLWLPLVVTVLGTELLPPGLGLGTLVSGLCQLVLYTIVSQAVPEYMSALLYTVACLLYSLAIWLRGRRGQQQGMELEPLFVSTQADYYQEKC